MANAEHLRTNEILSFGPFRLSAMGRILVRNDEPVSLGSRALDILIALVERSGEVVSRRQLVERVWPDLVVEEANLRVHIANLRKALGDGQDGARYITNIPGRGYSFVASVERVAPAIAAAPVQPVPAARTAAPHNLPPQLARMVGRNDTVAALTELLTLRRFVSVVGPGGMGKTTVALSVAHGLADDFNNAVFFVDLTPLADGSHVAPTVASTLGFAGQTEDVQSALPTFLAGRRILLLLDNCEHVIDVAAVLTEHLISRVPQLFILTTSRESLRAEGEHVHLLRPLDSPSPGLPLSATEALAWPSVQLFMERAVAGGYRTPLTDQDALIVAGICRRLDGIALAIELAASRVATYGIQGTADLLDHRFKLLWQGRRSALPRHQTMQAMLDWSYNLLTKRESTVLARLSIFVGVFTLDAAQNVAAEREIPAIDVVEALASLIDKSLVATAIFDGAVRYRLLDITRSYATLKLDASGEHDDVARRHARYHDERLASLASRYFLLGSKDLSDYTFLLGNVRGALEWSFSGQGDSALAVSLAAHSAPLFLGLSRLDECQRWCEQGLAMMNEVDRGGTLELALQEALAISAMFTRGNDQDIRTAIERGLGLAESLGSDEHQLHLLAGLHIFLTRIGDFQGSVEVAKRNVTVAERVGNTTALVMADWMLGTSYHLVGDQHRAQSHCEDGIRRAAAAAGPIDTDLFGYDHRVRGLIALARTLWLRGLPDRAAVVAAQAIVEAERRDHPVTLCIALIYTATVAIWSCDFETATQRIERLVNHAAKHSLAPYHAVGLALRGELEVAGGQPLSGVNLLRSALATLNIEQHHILTTALLRALAEGLRACGQEAEALTTIDGAVARQHSADYQYPDLLRARGEILATQAQPDLAGAEDALLRSIECARGQSALGWELRAAVPLAKLWVGLGRRAEARDLLDGVLQRFTEGSGIAPMQAASQFLQEILRDISPTPRDPAGRSAQ
jgi:predicted ATPase/DNA-binding winged helix-turn-helix (wHTH) protein